VLLQHLNDIVGAPRAIVVPKSDQFFIPVIRNVDFKFKGCTNADALRNYYAILFMGVADLLATIETMLGATCRADAIVFWVNARNLRGGH
jgi:hypothetical protein